MKIGTILFTYNRSNHTKQVLDALSKNSVLPEKLYIFQDGMKKSTNADEWNRVGEVIQDVNWCDTEIHISNENKGLSKSITFGLDYVLSECDAAIILEDDCVPDKQFMSFMVAALEKYEGVDKVYSVSGYAWDIMLPKDENDAYFNGRVCSLGWGTWKERWSQYEEDYNILERIKNNKDASSRLAIWGQDLESMLVNRLVGVNNSWAVFWALKVIEKDGYCLSSHRQFIHNIGFDGSGENSGFAQDRYQRPQGKFHEMFSFPDIIQSTQECEEEFQFLFAGKYGNEKLELYRQLLIKWLQLKQSGGTLQLAKEKRQNLAVWGKGMLLDCLIQEMQLSIECIVETRPSLEAYRGIPIVSVYELPENIKNLIVIPFFDISFIRCKVLKLRADICVMGLDELLP